MGKEGKGLEADEDEGWLGWVVVVVGELGVLDDDVIGGGCRCVCVCV